MAQLSGLLSTRRVFVMILALGLFAMAARNVLDPDVWWHLKTGQLTLANHAVFHTDPYSFTRAGQPWVNHEWLFDVLLFTVYRATGWAAPIGIFAAIIAAGFMLMFERCAGRPYVAGVITLWAALASAPLWGVRPQMVSFLLASIVLVLRDRAARRPRLWWGMVPLILIWVNLHAEYALGLALLAAFLAAELLDTAFGFATWKEAATRLRHLGLVLPACLAVVPLNPYGLKMFSYPLATLHSAAMKRYIVEWFSPDFHQATYLPLLLFLLATMAALPFGRRKIRPGELLLLCGGTFAALVSVRHIPIYLLIAAPLLSDSLQQLGSSRLPPPGAPPRVNLAAALLNVVLLALCIGLAALRVRAVIAQQPEAELKQFPVDAVDFLRTNSVSGPIFNSYDWGGYLIWELYPRKVFVDGRADVYGDEFLRKYSDTYNARDDWGEPLQRWNIATVVVPRDAALVAALQAGGDWQTVFNGRQAVVLCRLP